MRGEKSFPAADIYYFTGTGKTYEIYRAVKLGEMLE